MKLNAKGEIDYREPYPTWIVMGMDVLAMGILIASFRDAWSVVSSLGTGGALHGSGENNWVNSIVAGAVVLAIDASILLLEQARSHIKLRGGDTKMSDAWVFVLITLSAGLNVRYLTSASNYLDQVIGAVLGVAIPSTIAVLGYLKGDMMTFNARCRLASATANASVSEAKPAFTGRETLNLSLAPDDGVDRKIARLAVVSDEPAPARFRLHAASKSAA